MKIFLTSLISLIFFTGCFSSYPTHIDLDITSTKEINVDEDNVSAPLMLIFYELNTADKFNKYDYWELIDDKEDRLKQDVISKNKFPILPNEHHLYQIVFDEKAKHLGIVAKFRDITNSTWKYVIDLEKDEENEAEIIIDKYKIMKDE